MGKETIKKATFKDLLNRRIQREKDQFKSKDIYVTSLKRELTFVKPKEDIIINLFDEIKENSTMSEQLDVTRKLIYHSCPMLQDQEFQAELEITDPFDIVKALFDISDLNEIGEQLNELLGFANMVEDIKK